MTTFSIEQISPLFELAETRMADWLRSGLNTYYLGVEAGRRGDLYDGFRPYSILFATREYPAASLQDIYESAGARSGYQAKLRDAIMLLVESLEWGGPDAPKSAETLRLAPVLLTIIKNARMIPALEAISKRVCPANGWRLSPSIYDHALNAAIAMASSRIGGYMLNRLVFEDVDRIPSESFPAVFAALLRTVDPSDTDAILVLATKLLPNMPVLSPRRKRDLFDMIITAVGEEKARTVFSVDQLRRSYLPDELSVTASSDIEAETTGNVIRISEKRRAK